MTTGWTPDRIARATTLWLRGDSAEQISREIGGGLSRNAVIGKVNRLGLQRGRPSKPTAPTTTRVRLPKPPKAPSAPKMKRGPGEHRTAPKSANVNPFGASSPAEAARKRAAAEAQGAAKLQAFAEPANDHAIPLLSRRFGQCAWPVGTPDRPAEQMCCGQRVDPTATATTASYCERHRARASSGVVPSPRDLERMTRRAA